MKSRLWKTLFLVSVCFACYQFSSTRCFSLDLAIPENGQLVPYVHTNKANTVNTFITITNKSLGNQTVNFTYFTKEGYHVFDDSEVLTPFDTYTFDLHAYVTEILSPAPEQQVYDGPGYMAFAMVESPSEDLIAHAVVSFRGGSSGSPFSKQKEFVSIPVLPLQETDIQYSSTPYDYVADVVLTGGHHGVNTGDEVLLPYDLSTGYGTRFAIWVDRKLPQKSVQVVVFDEDENGFSFLIPVDPDLRLFVIDVGAIGIPFPDFKKGFILAGEFYPPSTFIPGRSGIAFSYIFEKNNAAKKSPPGRSYVVPGAHWPNP